MASIPPGSACKPGSQTSATVLPIHPNGDRPSLHARGASRFLELGDVDLDAIASAETLHVGANSTRWAGSLVSRCSRYFGSPVATRQRSRWICWVLGSPRLMQRLAPLLSLTDYLMPNGDQLSGMVGAADPVPRGPGSARPRTRRGDRHYRRCGQLLVHEGQCADLPRV